MTLEVDEKIYIFKTKEIWFADYPYDVDDCHSVTFYDCKNRVDKEGFECEEFPTLVIDLTQDLDTIWGNMATSCSYQIKRAQREGIQVHLNEDYIQFYALYRSFRQAKGLPGSAKPDTLKRGALFTAEVDGEVLGGLFYLEDKDNMRFLLGASKRLEVNKEKATLVGRGNRLLMWKAIEYAKAKGIKEFDLGGYYTGGDKNDPRYPMNAFKERFGGELTTHYIYRRDYSRIYHLARKANQLKRYIIRNFNLGR